MVYLVVIYHEEMAGMHMAGTLGLNICVLKTLHLTSGCQEGAHVQMSEGNIVYSFL